MDVLAKKQGVQTGLPIVRILGHMTCMDHVKFVFGCYYYFFAPGLRPPLPSVCETPELFSWIGQCHQSLH